MLTAPATNGCPCLLFCVQLHKLEAALNWHLQYGALQDASVLQLLMVQAAADGNAVIMSLLLPMFEKQGWLVSVCVFVSLFVHSHAIFLQLAPTFAGTRSLCSVPSAGLLVAHTGRCS